MRTGLLLCAVLVLVSQAWSADIVSNLEGHWKFDDGASSATETCS